MPTPPAPAPVRPGRQRSHRVGSRLLAVAARAVPGVPPPRRASPAPSPADTRETHLSLDLALACGELLLSAGAGASDVSATVRAVARACGLRAVEVDVTASSVTVCWTPSPDAAPLTALRVVRRRTLDWGLMEAVATLVQEMVDGRLSRWEAAARLDRVRLRPPPRGRLATTVGSCVLAASVTVLLGAGALAAGAALVATGAVVAVVRGLGARQLPSFFVNAGGAATATSAALLLAAVDAPLRPSLVVAGGIVLLLTGMTLVGAVQDALTGYSVTAGGRALEALLLTAGIIAGVSTALAVGQRIGVDVVVRAPDSLLTADRWTALCAAAVTSVAFAYVYGATRRTLPTSGACGALGLGVYQVCGDLLGLSPTLAAGAASVVVGLLAHVLAWRQNAPGLLFVTAGIVPLLPGLTIYSGLLLLAIGDGAGGLAELGSAAGIGLALAAGALLGEFLAAPGDREARHYQQPGRGLRPSRLRRPPSGAQV